VSQSFRLKENSILGRHAQKPRTAEAGHVAEDVRRIEPLPGDAEFQQGDEPAGVLVHSLSSQVVVDEEFAIAFARRLRRRRVRD